MAPMRKYSVVIWRVPGLRGITAPRALPCQLGVFLHRQDVAYAWRWRIMSNPDFQMPRQVRGRGLLRNGSSRSATGRCMVKRTYEAVISALVSAGNYRKFRASQSPEALPGEAEKWSRLQPGVRTKPAFSVNRAWPSQAMRMPQEAARSGLSRPF